MKLIIKSVIVCAVITASIYLTHNKKETTPLLLENIEALANGEHGGDIFCVGIGSVDCPLNDTKVRTVYESFSLLNE